MAENETVEQVTEKVEGTTFKTFESEEDLKKFNQSTASTAKNEMLKELGVKTLKEAKAQLKAVADKKAADMSEVDKWKTQFEETNTNLAAEQAKNKALTSKGEVASLVNEDFIDFVYFQIKDAEDIKTATAEFITTNPQYAKNQAPKTTGTKVTGVSTNGLLGYEKILAEKHPGIFKKE
jgi:hypothetical protein